MRARSTFLILFCIVFLATATSGRAERLLPLAEGDMAPTDLVTQYEPKNLRPVSHDPVQFAWQLEPGQALVAQPEVPTASSRSYHLLVTAAELSRGVTLAITAPGAVVRINPTPSDSGFGSDIDPTDLMIISPDGTKLSSAEATSALVDAAAMKQAGAPFAEGTSAFRIAPALGTGDFTLQSTSVEQIPEGRFAIHVFEPESPFALTAQASRTSYLSGDEVEASFALEGHDSIEIASATVTLRTPDGRSLAARIKGTSGTELTAQATLPAMSKLSPGLWEVHATVTAHAGAHTVRRDVHTAFAVAAPTARFTGDVSFERGEESLRATLPVEVSAAGRYEARVVLVAVGNDGQTHALATAHSAAYFPSGVNDLVLELPTGHAPLGSRLELRDLQLLDQGRLGELHRQAIAAALD